MMLFYGNQLRQIYYTSISSGIWYMFWSTKATTNNTKWTNEHQYNSRFKPEYIGNHYKLILISLKWQLNNICQSKMIGFTLYVSTNILDNTICVQGFNIETCQVWPGCLYFVGCSLIIFGLSYNWSAYGSM